MALFCNQGWGGVGLGPGGVAGPTAGLSGGANPIDAPTHIFDNLLCITNDTTGESECIDMPSDPVFFTLYDPASIGQMIAIPGDFNGQKATTQGCIGSIAIGPSFLGPPPSSSSCGTSAPAPAAVSAPKPVVPVGITAAPVLPGGCFVGSPFFPPICILE